MNISTKTAANKAGYDYQKKVYSKDLSIGDLVLLRDDKVRSKFFNQWKDKFEIVESSRRHYKKCTVKNHITDCTYEES